MRKLVVVCIALALAGCHRGTKQDQTTEAPPIPRSFTMLFEEPGAIDPAFVEDAYAGNIVSQVFDGLVAVDENLNIVPEIAQSWQVSPDRHTLTFEIRADARFHNGRTITADDFVYSFTRLVEPGADKQSIGAEYLRDVVGVDEFMAGRASSVRGLQAEDALHLRIELKVPNSTLLAAMAMPNFKVVPREAVGPDFASKPVGSGPFEFESWERGRQITLKANKGYYRGTPKLDRIAFLLMRPTSTREELGMFLDGRLQFLQAVGEDASFLANRHYNVIRQTELSVHFLGFNCTTPPFDDARVRRAVAHSIRYDRLSVIEPLTYAPAGGVIPPGLAGYSPKERPYRYDPVTAVRLLAEAGYSTGQLDRDIDYPSSTGVTGVGRQTDILIEEDLAKIGLRLRERYVPWFEFNRMVNEGKLPVFRLSWAADVPDTSSVLYSLFFSRAINNMFRYRSSDIDRLLQRAMGEFDEPGRSEAYAKAEAAILHDAPLIPLDFGCFNYAFQPYVRGVRLNAYGIADMALERIWYER
ncbi:MAG: ABC transporter substrate-binding protein [Acidobacteriota bacterium]